MVTNEVARNLTRFLDAYLNEPRANGAWISGFFGSGKSHLLKMLALLLENKTVNGQPALAYFLPKIARDAMLKGMLEKAASLPSDSILFNIDQKADTIRTTERNALLPVFLKVFNDFCGYYGKQGYIAQFERDLDRDGHLDAFRQAFQEISGKSWEDGRAVVALYKAKVDDAYQRVVGDVNPNIIDHYRSDYKVSIEDFAKLVAEHIHKQPAGYRLNFFVDEVGQFIAGNTNLMTNLQTIAESLATHCNGQAWVIVTAQDEMEDVVGGMEQRGHDFSKIQDRFKTRIKLTSANVDEVIEERLLKKKTTRPVAQLYEKHRESFGTLFGFSAGREYKIYRSQEDFVRKYPFVPYQFPLFQDAIKGISEHAGFEGRHSSIGERSMLGVFQEVVKGIGNQPVGQLATFDRMFEGIRTVLKTKTQISIQRAEDQLGDPFAVRVLKALFLVKYVKGFHATPRNLRVLLQESFEGDLQALEERIQEALTRLENQTYIQRIGEAYAFLTDEEQDIEREIKSTEVDERDVLGLLEELFFSGILKDRKIRFSKTGQDYPFTRMVDGQISGRTHELTIHLVTPFHENAGNLDVLKANALGKAELTVVLPPDDRLMRDAQLYTQTEKYLRQRSTDHVSDEVQRVLSEKRLQNQNRQRELRARLEELTGQADLLVSGNPVKDLPSSEARSRLQRGFETLVETVYHNLKMLYRASYSEDQIGSILNATPGLFSVEDAFGEPEQEMLAYIQGQSQSGQRSTLKSVVETFEKRPYGWYLAAIQCVLARLCASGKVEARENSTLLEGRDLEKSLRNTRNFANVFLTPQVEFSDGEIKRAKAFFQDFFDKPPAIGDARDLGEEFKANLDALVNEIEALHRQAYRFPFLKALARPLAVLRELQGKHYTYFLREARAQDDDLLELKEEIIDPIRRFMAGEQVNIFQSGQDFLEKQAPNFDALNRQAALNPLRDLLDDPQCYRGNRMAQVKNLLDTLQQDIEQSLEAERQHLLDDLRKKQESVHEMPDYAALDETRRAEVDAVFERLKTDIRNQSLIGLMRDRYRRFEEGEYVSLLNQIAVWARPAPLPEGDAAPARKVADAPPAFIRLREVLPATPGPIESAEDVETYLARLKEALLKAIEEGKRILP